LPFSEHDPNATSRRRKPGQEAAKFALDAETGRMVINDNSDNEGPSASAALTMDEDLSGRAYQEQLTSTEGMTRGRGGRIIFNKDTKRGRAIEAEGDMGVSLFPL
jgi:ribosomal RNA-processing protein 12